MMPYGQHGLIWCSRPKTVASCLKLLWQLQRHNNSFHGPDSAVPKWKYHICAVTTGILLLINVELEVCVGEGTCK